jgi:signal transduction histidine kinase
MTVAQSILKSVETLTEEQQREVRFYVESLRGPVEDGAATDVGAAGAALAGEVWPATEDFSDWERAGGK